MDNERGSQFVSMKRKSKKLTKLSTRQPIEDKEIMDIFNKYQKTLPKQKNCTVHFSTVYRKMRESGIDIFEDDRTTEVVKALPAHPCLLNFDNIDFELPQFQIFMSTARDFLLKCLDEKLAIQNFNFLEKIVELVEMTCANNIGDKISCEIPHLEKQNPNLWGISICSTDGQMLNHGDYRTPFTLQDASKVFLYALALELFGNKVEKYVGFQLSNLSNYACILHKNKTLNPAMESGAILLCSLIINEGLKGNSWANKFEYILSFLKKFCAKRHVSYNKSIYMSLSNNSQAYLAIGYFLESQKCFQWDHNLKEDLEFYLQIRSLEVNCESLSMIGATLANGGINPFTEEKVISQETCKKVFCYMQMLSGGTLSGYFIKLVCIPVVFSISGICLLILPWNLSFCFFSPKLHETLNVSSKPLQFITKLESEFNLHPFHIHVGFGNVLDSPRSECPNNCLLINEVCKGDIYDLAWILGNNRNIHFQDYMGKTILNCAASLGHLECVKYIISICPKLVKIKDIKGSTAKENAEYFEHKEVAEILHNYEILESDNNNKEFNEV